MTTTEDLIADRILSTAIYQGREGTDVTSEDRDSADYLHCQNAAREILGLLKHQALEAQTRMSEDEPKVWCETCQHEHIASIPRFTYLCKFCGWGQWYGADAQEHEKRCPGHETYEVEHVTRPLEAQTRPEDEKALADVLLAWAGSWEGPRKPSLLELLQAAGFHRAPAVETKTESAFENDCGEKRKEAAALHNAEHAVARIPWPPESKGATDE